MDAIPQHPLMATPQETILSREYKFASTAVTYIMNQRYRQFTHPISTASSDSLSYDIRMMLDVYYRRHNSEHVASYDQWFATNERSRTNYNDFLLRVKNAYLELPYSHQRLLYFLTEISVYASCMYRDGYIEAPDVAMLIIFDCLWPQRFFWFVEPIRFNEHWRYLDQYCKNTGQHNTENQQWRANT